METDLIEIDPRSHLEVADVTKHRYAKNLRLNALTNNNNYILTKYFA